MQGVANKYFVWGWENEDYTCSSAPFFPGWMNKITWPNDFPQLMIEGDHFRVLEW